MLQRRELSTAILIGISGWVTAFYMFTSVVPTGFAVILIWLVALFLGLYGLIFLLLRQKRRSVLVSFWVVVYFFLRANQIDSILNTILLVTIILALEFFFISR